MKTIVGQIQTSVVSFYGQYDAESSEAEAAPSMPKLAAEDAIEHGEARSATRNDAGRFENIETGSARTRSRHARTCACRGDGRRGSSGFGKSGRIIRSAFHAAIDVTDTGSKVAKTTNLIP